NKQKYNLGDISMPCYLMTVNRGGGITTMINALAKYLYVADAFEFCGIEKAFEFKLGYIPPDAYFSELMRLDNTFVEAAGYNRHFKGVVGINIDEWLGHTSEAHFTKFLETLAASTGLLTVFYIYNRKKEELKALESAISLRLRLEYVPLRFPRGEELVDYIDIGFMQTKGLYLSKEAKTLLCGTINEIAKGKHFNGFKTISTLADDILYHIFSQIGFKSKDVSAEILQGFSKESEYVRRLVSQKGSKKAIGFTSPQSKPVHAEGDRQ
ncbi:MAG: hypothetical protein FWE42_09735, partial [Defluviitaleaceae bacterium]|nr:hypothetical protein [Defluviitaleaceae bacterium]